MSETAKNFFRDGLVMDLAPDNTLNSQLTNALNATFVTFNGNELSLQNDMGNARVESAMLPKGYIPLGSAELGGIIYIASYNPLTKKCLLGSFPSPERNLSKEEINTNTNLTLSWEDFQVEGTDIDIEDSWINIYTNGGEYHISDDPNVSFSDLTPENLELVKLQAINNPLNKDYLIYKKEEIVSYIKTIDLGMPQLNPGDLFYICADTLKELLETNIWNGEKGYVDIYLATIDETNKIVKLEATKKDSGHIIGDSPEKKEGNSYDLTSYRDIINNQLAYDVYTAKYSGKLHIVAELVAIDDFEVGYDVLYNNNQYVLKFYNTTTSKYENVKPTRIEYNIKNGKHFRKKYSETVELIFVQYTSDEYVNIETGMKIGTDYVITITPMMDFGDLNKLSVTLPIKLNSVGTGTVDIPQWRYFIYDDKVLLNFILNISPFPGDVIENLTLEFCKYNITTGTFDDKPSFIISYDNLVTYNKNYTELIYFDSDENQSNFDGTLEKNSFYKVSVKSEKYNKIMYLYTAPIFNGFYENDGYEEKSTTNENGLVEKSSINKGIIQDFTEINHTYYYKNDEDENIYPLKLKGYIDINKVETITNTSNITKNIPTFIISKEPDDEANEKKGIMSISNQFEKKYEINPILRLEQNWGIFEFKDNKVTLNIEKNPEGSFETTISSEDDKSILAIKGTAEVTKELVYKPTTCDVYTIRPLIYDNDSARKYGIKLATISSEDATVEDSLELIIEMNTLTIPAWYYYQQANLGNLDFVTYKFSFVDNWSKPEYQLEFPVVNSGSYVSMDMYNNKEVLDSLSRAINNTGWGNFTIVPHIFELRDSCSPRCSVFLVRTTEINKEFILKKFANIYIAIDTPIHYGRDQLELPTCFYFSLSRFMQFFALKNPNTFLDAASRVWSFVMLNESGQYLPVNCFMLQHFFGHNVIGYAPGYYQLTDQLYMGGGMTQVAVMQPVLDLLLSIYKYVGTENQIVYKVASGNNVTNKNGEDSINIKYIKTTDTSNAQLNYTNNTNIKNLDYSLDILESNLFIENISDVYKTNELDDIYNEKLVTTNSLSRVINPEGDIIDLDDNLHDPNIIYYLKDNKLNKMNNQFSWKSYDIINVKEDNNGIYKFTFSEDIKDFKDIKIELTATLLENYDDQTCSFRIYLHDLTNILRTNRDSLYYSFIEGSIKSMILTLKNPSDNPPQLYVTRSSGDRFDFNSIDDGKLEWRCQQESKLSFFLNSFRLHGYYKASSEDKLEITMDLTCALKSFTTTGIGLYLTLNKDGLLCLKDLANASDSNTKMLLFISNGSCDWYFNKDIKFRNEFAI